MDTIFIISLDRIEMYGTACYAVRAKSREEAIEKLTAKHCWLSASEKELVSVIAIGDLEYEDDVCELAFYME